MGELSSQRLTLEEGLQEALKRREFVVHYQPKGNIETCETAGVEACSGRSTRSRGYCSRQSSFR
jgi:sensor c-di-GMP phosphodiesterase-like protein